MNFKQLKYEPIDDRILVQPGPVKKVICDIPVPPEEGINTGSVDDIKEVKTVKEKVRTAFRVGQVINNTEFFKEGDWVVYAERAAIKFDLLTNKDPDDKCPVLLKRYDIVAKVKNIE